MQKPVTITLILIFAFSFTAFTRQNNIPSLFRLLHEQRGDSSKVNILVQISNLLQNKNTDSAILILRNALSLAEKINYENGILNAYNGLGNSFYFKSEYRKAIEYYQKGLAIAEEINDKKQISTYYMNMGICHMELGDYSIALEMNLKSIKISENLHDSAALAYSYSNIGVIHKNMGNYSQALGYYLICLRIREKLDNKIGILYSYLNIGVIYDLKKDFHQAIEYFSKAMQIAEEENANREMGMVYNNLGSVYEEIKNYPISLKYHFKSLKTMEEFGSKEGIAASCINISNIYSDMSDFSNSLEFLTKGIAIAQHINNLDLVKNAYEQYAILYEKTGNFKYAYQYHKLYSEVKDSLFNEQSSKQITEMQTKYETEKKEAQIKLLNADKEKQTAISAEQRKRLYIILSGSILLLIAASGFLSYYVRSNRKQKVANIELSKRNNTIHKQKNEIESQKKIVEEKNRDIIDSIEYASRIQQAIIPDDAEMGRILGKEFFVFHRQKDIIGGDFYYLTPLATPPPPNGGELKSPLGDLGAKGSGALLALADCTGHGVPGALLSMLGKDQLNELVIGKGITNPEILLKKLDKQVTLALNPHKNMEIQDGMDMSVIRLSETHLDYAGARRPVIVVRNNEVMELSPTSESIGGKAMRDKKEFTAAKIELNEGDMIYLFTDGYGDQMGGPAPPHPSPIGEGISPHLGGWGGKKFKNQRLKGLLKEISSKGMKEQKEILQSTFKNWKGSGEQTDDVTVIGIRI